LPNIKSAKKRVAVTLRKTERNRMAKSRLKTTIKKVSALIEDGEGTAAQSAYIQAQQEIDKAVSKGLLHKNTAARRKSRLARGVKGLLH